MVCTTVLSTIKPLRRTSCMIFCSVRELARLPSIYFNSLEATKNWSSRKYSNFFLIDWILNDYQNTFEFHISSFVFPNTAAVWNFHNDSTSGSTICKITFVILFVSDVTAYTIRPLLARKCISLNKVVPKNS